jgi:hypothetical protein
MPEGGPTLRQFNLPTPPHSLQANFDNQIKLLGYNIPQIPNSQPLTPDPQLAITLYWQALTTPDNLTRFVQLIGLDGQIYAQNDSAPGRGNYPTHLWRPGEIVIETVTLPLQPDWPGGDYSLHIGLYQPSTGMRLSLVDDGDHVEISP